MELRNQSSRVPTTSCRAEGNTAVAAIGKASVDTAESENLCMCGHSKCENREIPSTPAIDSSNAGRLANLSEGTASMYVDGKSDDFVVPSTRVNKAATAVAEFVEERESLKGNIVVRRGRTEHRAGLCVNYMARQDDR